MYRPALSRLVFRVVGLLVLPILALATACGAPPPEEPTPRPLPEEQQELRPGVYRSEEFEPSLTFRVGEGWKTAPPEMFDVLMLTRGEVGGLGFVNAQEVYEGTKTGLPIVVEAPEDVVGWFRRHPYLDTSTPQPVMVGGVEGERFDVVVADLPEGYRGECGPGCVDLCRVEGVPPLAIWEGDKARVTVLEDVKGETVTIPFSSPATDPGRMLRNVTLEPRNARRRRLAVCRA